jgi:hypothetical protein
VKERPILFSAPMVRALLEGRKTQTRRIVKWKGADGLNLDFSGLQASDTGPYWALQSRGMLSCWTERAHARCPHGHSGDRLWVKEAYWAWGKWVPNGITKSGRKAWRFTQVGTSIRYMDGNKPTATAKRDGECGWVYRHGRFMPKAHSRLTREIAEVRVQRLQDISEEDAKAEGCEPWEFSSEQCMTSGERGAASPYRGGYACLWDEINGDNATWKSNPWVWAITFPAVTV